jgi:O-acetyl-ADP-ribose deacetylase (regulator of RNase III)
VVDAVVNAANKELSGGGGVDGAIHKAAGPELEAACRALGGCPTGKAKATYGFHLPARFIIHAVGPRWAGGKAFEAQKLASAYTESLRAAAELNCRSIAFPAISCGVYGYPRDEAMRVSREAILAWQMGEQPFERIRLVFFDLAMLGEAIKVWAVEE